MLGEYELNVQWSTTLFLVNKSQQIFLGLIPLDSCSERLLSVTVTMVMSIPLISHFLDLFLVNLSCQAPALPALQQ